MTRPDIEATLHETYIGNLIDVVTGALMIGMMVIGILAIWIAIGAA